jgi:hypothetical protein
MDVGLIDVDGHNFPNLPLMKLSAWHKRRGHAVKFYEPLTDKPDVVYKSKVFDFSEDYHYPINCGNVASGGTGCGLDGALPPEVETSYPDYGLYGITDTAYGFLTRGCPRACPFCIVSGKEGRQARKVADLSDFWRGQRSIKLLDPNILASSDKLELLEQLAESRAWVDFTQGLDIRLMDAAAAKIITRCKVKMLHFAWDSERDSDAIKRKLSAFKRQTSLDSRRLRVYVLTNFDTEFAFDLERVCTLRDMGYDPYIMVYDKQSAPKRYRQLQRWVNNKYIFHSKTAVRFEDYAARGRE